MKTWKNKKYEDMIEIKDLIRSITENSNDFDEKYKDKNSYTIVYFQKKILIKINSIHDIF